MHGRYSGLCQQPHGRANEEINVHVDKHVSDPVSSDVRLCSDDETYWSSYGMHNIAYKRVSQIH